jgi:hypothetical protein
MATSLTGLSKSDHWAPPNDGFCDLTARFGREGEAPQPVPTAHAQGAGHPRKPSDTSELDGAQSHAIGINYSIVRAE